MIQIGAFDAQITRKRIKNINLRIDRQGNVKVSAPMKCPLAEIQLFLQKKQDWIRYHQNRLHKTAVETVSTVSLEQRQQLEALLPGLIAKWEVQIGVKVNQWCVKAMKTRWGSCHPITKKICLNLYLIKHPMVCIEYVVVHELVHLLEASHNQRFYALMSQFMPEWKQYRSLLREHVIVTP